VVTYITEIERLEVVVAKGMEPFKVKGTVLKYCNEQADEQLELSMSHYNVKFATV